MEYPAELPIWVGAASLKLDGGDFVAIIHVNIGAGETKQVGKQPHAVPAERADIVRP